MSAPAPRPDAPAAEGGGPRKAAPAEPRKPSSGGVRPSWVIAGAVALALFAGYLAWRTAELSERNRSLAAELSEVRAELGAYRAHLDGARSRAADLRGQVEALETFLGQDPAAPDLAPAPGNDAPPAD